MLFGCRHTYIRIKKFKLKSHLEWDRKWKLHDKNGTNKATAPIIQFVNSNDCFVKMTEKKKFFFCWQYLYLKPVLILPLRILLSERTNKQQHTIQHNTIYLHTYTMLPIHIIKLSIHSTKRKQNTTNNKYSKENICIYNLFTVI